jgi:hypothetical protein
MIPPAARHIPVIDNQQELYNALSAYFVRYGDRLQDQDSFNAAVELGSLVKVGLLL